MKNIVARIKSYHSVSDEALRALQSEMRLVHYPKNTTLVTTGSIDRNVYFIENGVTRSIFHKDGIDTTTWFSMEGDMTFGMYSLYHNQPSVESVQTLTDCDIYVIPIERLNALYEKYIDIANWGRVLCAIGYSGADVDVNAIDVSFKSIKGCIDVCKNGAGISFSEEIAKEILLESEIEIIIKAGNGQGQAVAWGCDLTYDYVKINGDYRT